MHVHMPEAALDLVAHDPMVRLAVFDTMRRDPELRTVTHPDGDGIIVDATPEVVERILELVAPHGVDLTPPPKAPRSFVLGAAEIAVAVLLLFLFLEVLVLGWAW